MNPLEQWEARLRTFYRAGLRFIGEIPLSFDDVEEMGKAVKLLIQRQGLPRATEFLIRDYPATFITLMSAFAAHNNQQNYWQAFADLIGVDKNNLYTNQWHKKYIKIAKIRRLKVFDFADDPTPYVTSIRFQGGIPAYSLPDYFERMVLPAVQRDGLREVPAKDALKYLLEHASFVDSPVLDFLKNSGDLGIEFFEESRKLARHALANHGEILSPDQVDLPAYVVQAFEAFWERSEDEKQHWRKPVLRAAPYSEDTAAYIFLPEQEISLELAASRLFWRIEFPEIHFSQERTCRVSRSRQNTVTQPDYLAIPQPLQQVVVSLHVIRADNGIEEELRRWNLSFIPPAGKAPLLAFAGQDEDMIPSRMLPAGDVILLIPLQAELVFEGSGRKVEECVPLIGPWADWKMERWNLSQVWSVMVGQAGQPVGEVIPVQGAIAQPELTGGHLFTYQEDPDQPLYTTDIPKVKVPLSPGSTPQARLAHWQVQVRSQWEANPSINQVIRLADVPEQVEMVDDRGIYPLQNVLGARPAGIYMIRVDGPHGLNAEFRVRLWPKLLLLDHSMQLVPPSRDDKPAGFILRLQEGARCEVQAGMEKVEIQETAAGWQITAPPPINRVSLDLIAPSSSGGQVRVPVSIPLPRLLWGLTSEKTRGVLEWEQKLLHRSIDQLMQDGSTSLHVDMPGLGGMINRLRLRLVEVNDEEKILQEVKFIHTDFRRDWLRATLGQFHDSIHVVHSMARFELVMLPLAKSEEEIRIPLVELSRELEIEDVRMLQVSETTWKLTWKEEHPLRNRRVMIRPAWQPWQKPWEYKIPNKARGEFTLDEVALPKMNYSVYFYVLPDYEPKLNEPPTGINPFQIELCTPQERMETLQAELAGNGLTHNEQFRKLVEIAAIHDSCGESKQRDLFLSKASCNLVHLTSLDLLVGTLKWMADKAIDQPTKSFFFNKMFDIRIVGLMLRAYNLYDPALVEYLGFTSQVKNIPADSAKLLLKTVDDPIAVASCLRSLISKKDEELPGIVVKMMSQARLSMRDARELLAVNPAWAIEKIAELEIGPFTDRLLASLLPKIGSVEGIKDDPRVPVWMERAIPYENDPQVIKAYFQCLLARNHPTCFELMMKAYRDGILRDREVTDLLSVDPKWSLSALEHAPASDICQRWIDYLVENYPGAANIVLPGSLINTPFGQARIDYIEHIETGRLNKVRLGTPDIRLNTTVGDGVERFRLVIDYHSLTMTIPDTSRVWRCTRCNFVHPDQKKVTHHASQRHKDIAQTPLILPAKFDPKDIQVDFSENH